jgi:hypothetical protein
LGSGELHADRIFGWQSISPRPAFWFTYTYAVASWVVTGPPHRTNPPPLNAIADQTPCQSPLKEPISALHAGKSSMCPGGVPVYATLGSFSRRLTAHLFGVPAVLWFNTSRTGVTRRAGVMSQEMPDGWLMVGHVEGPVGDNGCGG